MRKIYVCVCNKIRQGPNKCARSPRLEPRNKSLIVVRNICAHQFSLPTIYLSLNRYRDIRAQLDEDNISDAHEINFVYRLWRRTVCVSIGREGMRCLLLKGVRPVDSGWFAHILVWFVVTILIMGRVQLIAIWLFQSYYWVNGKRSVNAV